MHNGSVCMYPGCSESPGASGEFEYVFCIEGRDEEAQKRRGLLCLWYPRSSNTSESKRRER